MSELLDIVGGGLDIRGGIVEIDIREDGGAVWINVNGVTRLRVSRPESIVMSDRRRKRRRTATRRKR